MSYVEIENDTEVSITDNKDISAESVNVEVCTESSDDLNISANKREFNVVGDNLYIPRLAEDAPAWMTTLIETLANTSLGPANKTLLDSIENLNNVIAELDIAKNTYTQSIISLNEIDQRINSAITTLNTSLGNSDSTILNIAQTATTPEEARAISADVLSSSITDTESGNSLGSIIDNINQTVASSTSANAESITALESSISGEFDSNATIVEALQTYVGIDEAGASTNTGLSSYVEGSDGTIGGADSDVSNSVYVENGVPTSKWEYDSVLNVNGVTYDAGFGLKLLGDGTVEDPFDSEFWINAEKFRFTNTNGTGQATPFSIDASGDTPKVSFNGLVDFTNTNLNSGFPGTSTINGGLITTNTVSADQINTVGLIAENISATEIVGKNIIGARISGAVIKASYLDLDGELEVLTNYHISLASYNANPSLYTDAVFIEADNEYRIPSISNITENSVLATYANGATSTGSIHSYLVANVGNNLKAVKVRPVFRTTDATLISAYRSVEGPGAETVTSSAELRLGSLVLATVNMSCYRSYNISNTVVSVSSPYASTVSIVHNYVHNQTLPNTHTYVPRGGTVDRQTTLSISIPLFGDVRIKLESTGRHPFENGTDVDTDPGFDYMGVEATVTISTQSGTNTLPFDWNNREVTNVRVGTTGGYTGFIKLAGIGINNLA